MKIGIIGVGRVGSAIAYSLLFVDHVKEIYLADKDEKKLMGEYWDIITAASLGETGKLIIKADDNYEMLRRCDIIFIAAGKARDTGDQNMDSLYEENRTTMKEIFAKLEGFDSNRIYMVTNPVERLAGYFNCNYIGSVVDKTRSENELPGGGLIIDMKGFTNWAIAMEACELVRTMVKR